MARQSKTIEPLRLCDAAEAVLQAMVEVAEQRARAGKSPEWPNPVDLIGKPGTPAVLTEFTRDEVEEATMFLIRMGVIEVRTA